MSTPPDPVTAQRIADAPMPTAKTLRNRNNVPYQFIRLCALTLKMMKVIRSGHGGA